MSVDLYAPCPCGNGKKIKFCKCRDSVGQMDQVLTMIEGGQLVPGLDRLKSILDEHPDAAWALAIRGRLLLDLREYESLSENADRFIRLQPANPLALTQKAVSQVFNEEVQASTDSLLEALNESGNEVDSFLMDVALIVAMGLAQKGVVLSARVYALLSISSQGYEAESANEFLSQLDTSPNVNHLLKSLPPVIERPGSVEWAERYDEAVSLLHSNRVLLAQDKLESLRRVAPGQAAVLSGLFHCAVWRGDLERQSELAKQLSDVETLKMETRQQYRAISALLVPKGALTVDSQTFRVEFEDIDQAEMALVASDRTKQLPADSVSRIRIADGEVRPRSAFHISDRAIDSSDSDQTYVSIAIAGVYGRQTDQSASAVVYDVPQDRVEEVKRVLTTAISDGTVKMEEPKPVPMLFALNERPLREDNPSSMAEMARMNRQFAAEHDVKRACDLPLPILGGKSLRQCADDGTHEFERAVVIRVLEGNERLMGLEGAVDSIREIAKVESLPEIHATDDTIQSIPAANFFRVAPDKLSTMSLYVLASHARSTGNLSSCNRFAKTLIEKTTGDEVPEASSLEIATDGSGDSGDAATANSKQFALEGYTLAMMSSVEPTDSIAIGDEGVEFAKKHGMNFASLLLARLELCLSLADQDGFRETLMTIEKNYGSDPGVMARVQQMLVDLGILRPDGSLRQPGAGAPAAAGSAPTDFTPAAPPEQRPGGVWTPDAASAPKPAGEQGESKIWVPGMD